MKVIDYDYDYEIEIKELCQRNNLELYDLSNNNVASEVTDFFEKELNNLAIELAKRGEIKHPFRCKLIWIDDDRINAFTGFLDKSNYTYYIALHSYFLTELISDVDDECLKLCIPVDYTANAKFDFCFIGKNDDYELITKHIANLVFLQVLQHEVGHIICGHIDGNYSYGNFYKYQVEECFADFYSFKMCFCFWNRISNCKTIDIVKEYAIACYILWSLVLPKNVKKSISDYDGNASMHPHPATRLKYMLYWLSFEPVDGLDLTDKSGIANICYVIMWKYFGYGVVKPDFFSSPEMKEINDFNARELKTILHQSADVIKKNNIHAYYLDTNTSLTSRMLNCFKRNGLL